MLFTFIIGISIFLLIFSDPVSPKFPDIPAGILGLLGISAGSYVVAKGVQAQRDTNLNNQGSGPTPAVPAANNATPTIPVAIITPPS
jgi:hypothetical protein